jgi:hypothetical protein
MIEFDEVAAFDISLQEDSTGQGRVHITMLNNGEISLTSHQARVLATELIMAASRAEVRENLKRNDSAVRRDASQTSSPSRRFFEQSFAK